jgi:hypothetical protein
MPDAATAPSQTLASYLVEMLAEESNWLAQFSGDSELLELYDRLRDCRVKKEGPRIFSAQ